MSIDNKNPALPNHFKDLLLLFSVPICIAIIVAAVIYIPQMLANPQYSFIYYACNAYCPDESYTVDANGQIQLYPVDNSYDPLLRSNDNSYDTTDLEGEGIDDDTQQRSYDVNNSMPIYDTPYSLRIYNTKTNSSSPITLKDAQQYKLNPSSKSPDGYTLEQAQSRSGFAAVWSGPLPWQLKSGMQSKNVTLSLPGANTYSESIHFLGWVRQ